MYLEQLLNDVLGQAQRLHIALDRRYIDLLPLSGRKLLVYEALRY